MAYDYNSTEDDYSEGWRYTAPEPPPPAPQADPNVFPNGLPPSGNTAGDKRVGYDSRTYQWDGSAWVPWDNGQGPYAASHGIDQGGSQVPPWDGRTTTGGDEDEWSNFEVDPSYLQPFGQTFSPPQGSEIPNYPSQGTFNYPDFVGPGPFNAPTGDDILKDPSYQFRIDQGRGALEAGAAGRGLLNSGGHLKDLLNYGQSFASQEYKNIWDRDFNTWNTDWAHSLGSYGVNRGNTAGNFATNYGVGRDTYQTLLSNANTSYDRGWGQFLNEQNNYYTGQDSAFNKLYKMQDLGVRASA